MVKKQIMLTDKGKFQFQFHLTNSVYCILAAVSNSAANSVYVVPNFPILLPIDSTHWCLRAMGLFTQDNIFMKWLGIILPFQRNNLGSLLLVVYYAFHIPKPIPPCIVVEKDMALKLHLFQSKYILSSLLEMIPWLQGILSAVVGMSVSLKEATGERFHAPRYGSSKDPWLLCWNENVVPSL